jgi:LacI family transcriptional regulator
MSTSGQALEIHLMLPSNAYNNREIRRGIYQYALPNRNWIIIFLDQSVSVLRALKSNQRCAGLIGRLGSPELAEAAAELKVPVINIHGGDPLCGLPTLGPNSFEVGQFAAQKLVEGGATHFAFYGIQDASFSVAAREGFQMTLEQMGHTVQVLELKPWTLSHKELNRTLRDWLASLPKPVAIYCPDDVFTHALGCHAVQLKLRIPEEVALLGTNNDEVMCLGMQPALSSIRLPWRQIGARAAALLEEMMQGALPPRTAIRLGPPDLVARQSTHALHCRDELVEKALLLIHANAFAPLGIEELSRRVGASRRNLEKRFRAVLNRTPIQEQNRIRLEELKRMLRHDPRSIEQIADACGFSSPVYLNQFFQREAGMAPGAYRKAFGEFFGGR